MRTRIKRKPTAAKGISSQSGFTLSEVMVASAVFGLTVLGLVYCQMFGMRQDQLANSKVGAAEMARLSFNKMSTDIRAAKSWMVGNGDLDSFTEIPMDTNQRGNALKLNLTMDTNNYTVYYFDTNASKLFRLRSGDGDAKCIAEYLTNAMYFQAQDYRGSNQTTRTHKGVINVVMEFCQFQFPITKIGQGSFYDYYRMDLRLTPHAPDGP